MSTLSSRYLILINQSLHGLSDDMHIYYWRVIKAIKGITRLFFSASVFQWVSQCWCFTYLANHTNAAFFATMNHSITRITNPLLRARCCTSPAFAFLHARWVNLRLWLWFMLMCRDSCEKSPGSTVIAKILSSLLRDSLVPSMCVICLRDV